MTEFRTEKIVMIGSGNVASYLAASFYQAGHNIDVVYSRTGSNAKKLAGKVNARWCSNIGEIESDAGIWIFALTDQATLDIADKLDFRKALLVHTAGSIPMDIFSGHSDDYGVLYPLQTISGGRPPGVSDVPLCIESNRRNGVKRLRSLAGSISSRVYDVTSDKRKLLHLAAVFACNFTNHMYALAEDIARKADLPFELFHSLIRETADKAIDVGPRKSRTGPAVRNDRVVIEKHLDLLSFSPKLSSLYSQLTESIKMGDKSGSGEKNTGKTAGMECFTEKMDRVQAFAFDVDGVFSDGKMLLGADGDVIRSMNIKDGFAIQLAVRKGYPVAVITGGNSEPVRRRFSLLGVTDIYLKSSRKIDDFNHFCEKNKLEPENVLYMGDDLPDYPVMEKAGFSACPKDAVPEIKAVSGYVSDHKGGEGCVRDVVEQIMKVQCKWMDADSFIL